MTGRVAQRSVPEGQGVESHAVTLSYRGLRMNVSVDICDNCGVMYAFSARKFGE